MALQVQSAPPLELIDHEKFTTFPENDSPPLPASPALVHPHLAKTAALIVKNP